MRWATLKTEASTFEEVGFMITPTKESLDAFRPEYEPHPVPTEAAPRMPRWAKVLAVLAVLGVIGVIVARAR
jgi:hypothetical protein